MSRATLERAIGRFEAIGQSRPLSELESSQPEKLISVERRERNARRRYEAQQQHAPASTESRGAPSATIVERLEATIARMARDRLLVRAIYLTPADRSELEASGAIVLGDAPTYRGYPVRRPTGTARRSLIYSRRGVARSVSSAGQ